MLRLQDMIISPESFGSVMMFSNVRPKYEYATDSGNRTISMSNAYMAFSRIIRNRPETKVEMLIDGHSEFLFLDKDGKPKVGMHLENYMRHIQKKLGQNVPGFPISPDKMRFPQAACTDKTRKPL